MGAELDGGGNANRELDRLFDALSHERRRKILQTLSESGQLQSLSALAAELAAGGADGSDGGDEADVERIRITLSHWHVPALVDAGLITRGPDGTVSLAAPAGTVTETVDPATGGIASQVLKMARER